MADNEKGKKFLLGLFAPHYHEKIKDHLKGWKEFLCEPYKSMAIEEWCELKFNFGPNQKSIVYRDLARVIVNDWYLGEQIAISRFFALYSNLADNEDFDQRTETIRHSINKKKALFK